MSRSGHQVLIAAVFLLSAALARGQDAPDGPPGANPARPTVTNPATLSPVGYLQFEQGYLGSLTSPDTATQYGVNQVTKLAVHPRLMLQVQSQPFAQSLAVGDTTTTRGAGDILLGAQGVLFTPDVSSAKTGSSDPATQSPRKTPIPTVAVGYLGRVHSGTTPDVDLGGFSQGVVLLFSGDISGFHYDTNYLISEQGGDSRPVVCSGAGSCVAGVHTIRRAQFGQTLSVNHSIFNPNLQLSVELYHFAQPLVYIDDNLRPVSGAQLVDILVAPSYQVRPNLVVDCGFSHGFTSTSTRWQSFAGFTYLLPHRLWPQHK